MSDYLQVPPSYGNTLFDFYENGVNICEYAGIGHISVAYNSGTNYNIRVGVYYDANYYFVFVSDTVINNIDIRLVGGAPSTVASCSNLMNQNSRGYYAIVSYTPTNPSFNVTVYSSLNDVLEAIGFPATPSVDSGVVVTINASLNYTPPSTNGVIVTVIGRLLDSNQQGGTSVSGGGQGTFDNTSDVVPIPPLPTLSASGCGLITLFRPTLVELQALGSYLWTNITDFIENLNKLFMNPMDYIISLNIFPCNPSVGSPRSINIGSVTTSILMPPVMSQWYEFDCGTININEYWGSALDYAPNTKISLFLPFIGSVSLNTDEVMGKRLSIKYRIDLLSGQCVAMVTVAGLSDSTGTVYYQYTGECAVSVPLTGADWSRIYSAAIGAIGAAVTGGIAAGAAGAAAGGATAALVTKDAAQTAVSAGTAFADINATSKGITGVQQMRQNILQASQMALDAGRQAASAPSRVAHGIRSMRIANTVNNTVGQVISGKGYVTHSGTISGNAGMLGVKVPYVIIEFPNQSLAENYKHFAGYPSNMYARLGDLSGYTECEQVMAGGLVNQTDAEMSELVEALKGGVYL